MLAQFVILIAALIFMPFVVRLIAPGFADNPGQLSLTVSLARITFPYLILTVVAIQLSAMLNAINKFWAAAAWSNFQNIGMIATLLASHWFPNAAYAAACKAQPAWDSRGGEARAVTLRAMADALEAHRERLSCLMVTYPSTHGVFEESIQDICATVHACRP